jgi:hypothetical protein
MRLKIIALFDPQSVSLTGGGMLAESTKIARTSYGKMRPAVADLAGPKNDVEIFSERRERIESETTRPTNFCFKQQNQLITL